MAAELGTGLIKKNDELKSEIKKLNKELDSIKSNTTFTFSPSPSVSEIPSKTDESTEIYIQSLENDITDLNQEILTLKEKNTKLEEVKKYIIVRVTNLAEYTI